MRTSVVADLVDRWKKTLDLSSLKFSGDRVEEMAWVTGGQFLTLLLSLVSVKLTTSIGPEEYGKYVLASSVGGIFSLAFIGPLDQGYVRLYFQYAREQLTRWVYCRSLFRVLGYLTVVFAVLGGCVVLLAHVFHHLDIVFSVAAALMISVGLLNLPLNGMLNAMRLRKHVAIVQVAERTLIVLALWGVMQMAFLTATTVMLAVFAATFPGLAAKLFIFGSRSGALNSEPDGLTPEQVVDLRSEMYRAIATYSLPFVAWGATSWLQLQGERWVISAFLSSGDVGRYGLAMNVINSSVVLLYGILTQFVSPIIFQNFSNDRETNFGRKGMQQIRVYVVATVFLFSVFALLFLLVGEPLIALLSTKAFTLDARMLCALTLGLGMFYVGQSLSIVGLSLRKPMIYVRPKIITGLASVLLYIGGCYWMGLFGVSWAIVVVGGLSLLLVFRANRSALRSEVYQS